MPMAIWCPREHGCKGAGLAHIRRSCWLQGIMKFNYCRNLHSVKLQLTSEVRFLGVRRSHKQSQSPGSREHA
jgi:hypothetical protein